MCGVCQFESLSGSRIPGTPAPAPHRLIRRCPLSEPVMTMMTTDADDVGTRQRFLRRRKDCRWEVWRRERVIEGGGEREEKEGWGF